jgi:hypothetical protein
MERETGIEPATNSLEGCDSTTELLPLASRINRSEASRTSWLQTAHPLLYHPRRPQYPATRPKTTVRAFDFSKQFPESPHRPRRGEAEMPGEMRGLGRGGSPLRRQSARLDRT